MLEVDRKGSGLYHKPSKENTLAEKIPRALPGAMLLLAFLIPSSINGEISKNVVISGWVVSGGFLFIGLISSRKLIPYNILLGTLFGSILLLFTIKENSSSLSWGATLPLAIYFISVSWKPNLLGKNPAPLFLFSFLFVTALAMLPFLFRWAHLLVSNYYTYGWEGIVSSMLARGKPVSIFGSHSIAAFFYFIFFLVFSETAYVTKRTMWWIACLVCILLILSLRSTSSYMLLLLATSVAVWFLVRPLPLHRRMLIILPTVLILAIALYFSFDKIMMALGKGHSYSGLFVRYNNDGVLSETIQEILRNPLLGSGLLYDENLYYTDSGYINLLLRVGVFGAAAWYAAFLIWVSRVHASLSFKTFLAVAILTFEIGYPILQTWRFLLILPFISIVMGESHYTHKNIAAHK